MDISKLIIPLTGVCVNTVTIRSFHLRWIYATFQILTSYTVHLSIHVPIWNIRSVQVIGVTMEVTSLNELNIIGSMDLQLALQWDQLLRRIGTRNNPFQLRRVWWSVFDFANMFFTTHSLAFGCHCHFDIFFSVMSRSKALNKHFIESCYFAGWWAYLDYIPAHLFREAHTLDVNQCSSSKRWCFPCIISIK